MSPIRHHIAERLVELQKMQPAHHIQRNRQVRGDRTTQAISRRPKTAFDWAIIWMFETQRVKPMIRKLKSGEYRLYSRKKDAKTGKRRNLGTFKTREAAQHHERAVQYFKRH